MPLPVVGRTGEEICREQCDENGRKGGNRAWERGRCCLERLRMGSAISSSCCSGRSAVGGPRPKQHAAPNRLLELPELVAGAAAAAAATAATATANSAAKGVGDARQAAQPPSLAVPKLRRRSSPRRIVAIRCGFSNPSASASETSHQQNSHKKHPLAPRVPARQLQVPIFISHPRRQRRVAPTAAKSRYSTASATSSRCQTAHPSIPRAAAPH